MSNQNLSESAIVRQFAEHTAKHVTSRVIRALQRLTDSKLSGEDSGLENSWDEICVQVQSEESIFWDAYVQMARATIRLDVEALAAQEREALWLQTQEGSDWESESEAECPHRPVCDDDIVNYLWSQYVLQEAGDWSNRRIRAHLERSEGGF